MIDAELLVEPERRGSIERIEEEHPPEREVSAGRVPVTERSVDVQVAALRKKLGNAGDYIETVRGVGYRLKK